MDKREFTGIVEDCKQWVNYWDGRKARASARLAETTGNFLYFAILGLETESDLLEVTPVARLQRVTEPPGEVELAGALVRKDLFSAIGRYSGAIRHELAVNREIWGNDLTHSLAWHICSALRILTKAEILILAVADHSWSTIAAVPHGTCNANLLEDVPTARALQKPVVIRQADLLWSCEHLPKLVNLMREDKFRLAADAICTHHHHSSDLRVAAALLWAGIEAIFGLTSELRFRLAALLATLLEPRGPGRYDLYRELLKLYDTRSKAVHGVKLDDQKLRAHVVTVRELLARLLCIFIDSGHIPTQLEMEKALFS